MVIMSKSFLDESSIWVAAHANDAWVKRAVWVCMMWLIYIDYLKVDCIYGKYGPLSTFIRYKLFQSSNCYVVTKVIVGDHNQLLWFVYDCRSSASVCIIHLCTDPISGETDHFSWQATLMTSWLLNPSDDLEDKSIIFIFFGIDWSSGQFFFIL